MFHGAGGSQKVTLEFEFRRTGRIVKLACPGQSPSLEYPVSVTRFVALETHRTQAPIISRYNLGCSPLPKEARYVTSSPCTDKIHDFATVNMAFVIKCRLVNFAKTMKKWGWKQPQKTAALYQGSQSSNQSDLLCQIKKVYGNG
jgi:hypothetical protein